MKRSELKRLIREVIEEISFNKVPDLYSADSEFDEVVDLQIDSKTIEDVPVHVYAFLLPTRQEIVALAKEDVKDGNQVVFKKGEDVFDYITDRTYERVYRAIG